MGQKTRSSLSRTPAEYRMRILPEWTEMERVNEQVYLFLQEQGLSEDLVDTSTMVVCELSENAIKYGDNPTGADNSIEIIVTLSGNTMTAQVINYYNPEVKDHLRQLDRTLQWTRGFHDPFQAYMERVKQISREQAQSRRSELGIVRIAYEAHATIDFILGEDNILSVSAVVEFT